MPDQRLVLEVIAPDNAAVGVAAVEVLAVVGHVAQVVVGVVDAGDVKLLDEIAFKVVFVNHRQHVRRLAPGASVDVFAVAGNSVLAAGGTGERGDEVPHVA